MSTKTKSKPKKKTPASPDAAPQSAQQLRAAIAKGEAKLQGMPSYGTAYDKLQSELTVQRAALEEAEVHELPAPAAIDLSFQERTISIATISISGNHREQHDAAALARLAASLRTQQLQQRIGVRAMGDGRFELIFGSRRLAAAKLAEWDEIPAKVYAQDLTPAQVEILRSIENLGRKELTPVEQAMAIARTIDAIETTLARALTGSDEPLPMGVGHKLENEMAAAGGLEAYVGQQFGRPAKWVKDHAYVSKLGGRARELLTTGRIDIGHARELAKLGDKDRADRIAEDAARSPNLLGGRDVEWVRRRIVDEMKSLRIVPWQLDVAFGQGVIGCTGHACVTCPFNSKSDPDLFGGAIADEPEAGTCTHVTCYQAKQKIVDAELAKAAKKATPIITKRVAQAAGTENEDANPIGLATVGHLLPRIVKPASGLRRLQKDLACLLPANSPTTSPTAAAGGNKPSSSKRTPEEAAAEKLGKAQDAWHKEVKRLLFATVFADGLMYRVLALLCIDQSDIVDELDRVSYQDIEAARGVVEKHSDLICEAIDCRGPGLPKLAARLTAENLENRLNMEMAIGGPTLSPLYAKLAAGWGAAVPPEPVLEDFLPKPKQPKKERTNGNDQGSEVLHVRRGHERDSLAGVEGGGDRPVVGDAAQRARPLADGQPNGGEGQGETGAGGSLLPKPDQPENQPLKWDAWAKKTASACRLLKLDVVDVLPTAFAIGLYEQGLTPKEAALRHSDLHVAAGNPTEGDGNAVG